MNSFQKGYNKSEHQMFILNSAILLSELIYLNYSYCNMEYEGTKGDELWQKLIKRRKFNDKEKKLIIKNAMILLNIKYHIKLNDNIVEQFNILDIKK